MKYVAMLLKLRIISVFPMFADDCAVPAIIGNEIRKIIIIIEKDFMDSSPRVKID